MSSTAFYSGLAINGKTCLVTGGTSGLGRAIALGLAAAGAKVVAASSNPEKVNAMAKELGKDHLAVELDVGNEKQAADVMAGIAASCGRIDAVIHAAGIIRKVPSMDMAVADFDKVVRTNLTGSFIISQAAGRLMRGQSPDTQGMRGCIVLVASLNSYMSLSEVLAYAASKSGVLGLVRGLANEWAQYGIRVNGLAPGVFPTDLNRPLIEGTPRGEWLKKHTPLNRFGNADEVVGAAIYLVSPSASYTTGHTMVIDGGFLTRGV